MSKQQTAVEWLFNQLPDHLRLSKSGFEMLQQAKAMERERMEQVFNNGKMHGYSNFLDGVAKMTWNILGQLEQNYKPEQP